MSGQCYGCGTEFSFFKKEHGCKNCGFAFCSNCLPKKTAVPKLDNTKHHVCNRCFDILTGKMQAESTGSHSPPAAYVKRVAALQQQETQPKEKPKSHSSAAKPQANYTGLSKADREIAQRLEKLREKPQEVQPVSDKEINERLAHLKGEDPAVHTAPTQPVYHPPDRRTQVEQIDDLLEEIASEVDIDSWYPDPAKDVENRLARLHKDERGALQDEHNNLDKNDMSPQKNFVKNIDVGAGCSKNNITAGNNSAGQPTSKTDVDLAEVEALMARAAQQMEQEAQQALEGMKKDKQLMEQLAEIKRQKNNKGGDEQSLDSNIDNLAVDDDNDDSENEEEAAKRIMQRFLEEAKLDEQVGEAISAGPDSTSKTSKKTEKSKAKQTKEPKKNTQAEKKAASDDDEYEDPDELPFCCICTEDATIRCRDCDMDLYCARCFREGHKELGFTDHRTSPYKAPKGYR